MFRGILRRSLMCLSAGSGSLLNGSSTSITCNSFADHHAEDNDNDNAASFLSALSEENEQINFNHVNEEDMVAFNEASHDCATHDYEQTLSYDKHSDVTFQQNESAATPEQSFQPPSTNYSNNNKIKNNLNSTCDILRAALPQEQLHFLLNNPTIVMNNHNNNNDNINSIGSVNNEINNDVKPHKKIMTKAKRIRLAAAMQAAAAQLQAAPSPANALIHSHHVAELKAEEELLHVSLSRLQAERELATVRHNCDVQLRRFREGIRRRDFAVREMVRAVTGSAMGSSSSSSSSNNNNINNTENNSEENTSSELGVYEENHNSSSNLTSQDHTDNHSTYTQHDEGSNDNSNNDNNNNNNSKVNSHLNIHKQHGSYEERFENEGGNSGHYAPPVSTTTTTTSTSINKVNKSTKGMHHRSKNTQGKVENQSCFELGGEAADPIGKAGEPEVHEGNTRTNSHQSNARKTNKQLQNRKLKMTLQEKKRARAFEVATRMKTPEEQKATLRVVTNPSAVSVSSDVHSLSESKSTSQNTNLRAPRRRNPTTTPTTQQKATRQRQAKTQRTPVQGKRSNSRKRVNAASFTKATAANKQTNRKVNNASNSNKSNSRSPYATRSSTQRKRQSNTAINSKNNNKNNRTNNNRNSSNKKSKTFASSHNKTQSRNNANTLRKRIQTVQRQKMMKKTPLRHKKTSTNSKQGQQQKKVQKRNTHKKENEERLYKKYKHQNKFF